LKKLPRSQTTTMAEEPKLAGRGGKILMVLRGGSHELPFAPEPQGVRLSRDGRFAELRRKRRVYYLDTATGRPLRLSPAAAERLEASRFDEMALRGGRLEFETRDWEGKVLSRCRVSFPGGELLAEEATDHGRARARSFLDRLQRLPPATLARLADKKGAQRSAPVVRL
jgi:hypothetical protein